MHFFSGDDQLNSILSNINHSVFSQGRQSFVWHSVFVSIGLCPLKSRKFAAQIMRGKNT